uniref:C2H2-type domain-containing protein n=1 Tax=Pristionchus pacificus TaxID=54126 RepID=A0A8R1YW40_PRIPA
MIERGPVHSQCGMRNNYGNDAEMRNEFRIDIPSCNRSRFAEMLRNYGKLFIQIQAFDHSTGQHMRGVLLKAVDLLQILVNTNADTLACSTPNVNKDADNEETLLKTAAKSQRLIMDEDDDSSSDDKSFHGERLSKNGKLFSKWKYKCPHCHRRFSRKGNARAHVMSHSDDIEVTLPYKCDSCDKRFAWVHTLERHMTKHLPNFKKKKSIRANFSATNEKKHIKCKICGKSYSPFVYAYHKETHLAEIKRRHKCELCGDDFRNATNLKRHNNIHSGKIDASEVVELIMHLKRHEDGTVGESTDDEDAEMKVGGATFAIRASVYQHIKRLHPNRKFADGARTVFKPGNKRVKAKVRKSKK